MAKVALITGSTRVPRVGDSIVSWVHDVLKTRPSDEIQIEPIAIADFNLPVFDEPVAPAMVPAVAQFTKDHSKKWSAAMGAFQGYVFVVPEYNYGLAGGTKNAIDYLYNDVTGKPVVIISYGINGGAQANAQLSGSLGVVIKMKVVPTKILLSFAPGGDMGSAIGGTLGEESLKGWNEGDKKGEILKAFEELKDILEHPEKETKVST